MCVRVCTRARVCVRAPPLRDSNPATETRRVVGPWIVSGEVKKLRVVPSPRVILKYYTCLEFLASVFWEAACIINVKF